MSVRNASSKLSWSGGVARLSVAPSCRQFAMNFTDTSPLGKACNSEFLMQEAVFAYLDLDRRARFKVYLYSMSSISQRDRNIPLAFMTACAIHKMPTTPSAAQSCF